MPKKIIILITHGFRVRNILYTTLWQQLRATAEITLLCPETDVPGLRDEFGREATIAGYKNVPLRGWEGKSAFIRRYILSNPVRNRTINLFSMARKRDKPLQYRLETTVNFCFGRWRFVRALWHALERVCFRGEEFDALLKSQNPDLIITTDYASHPVEVRLLRAAKRRGCRTLSIVYGWDNLSSKGVMGETPDALIVWNEVMKQEAIELHEFPAEKIYITGAAQFDIYFDSSAMRNREECCRRWGLDPARPIVTYGTITSQFFPPQLQIIELLLEARRDGRLPPEVQLLIRVHPQLIKGYQKDAAVEKMVELAGSQPGLAINLPRVRSWGELVSPEPDDSRELAEILWHSHALLHPGSTLTIDAAAMNCPIIGIAFDGRVELPYESSIRRWWDYTYQQPALESDAVNIVRSAEDMIAQINVYLASRATQAAERKALTERLCAYTDGRSARRIADAIDHLLD